MQSVDDHQIMLQVQAGQTDKLEILFERYNKQLYNLFLWQTKDPSASEDLVQDVFYRILKYRRSYRGEAQFKTWMFSIAHSARMDLFRKKKHPTASISEGIMIADENPTPDRMSVQADESRLLHEAISRLSESKRAMLYMSRFEQMKYDEIARIMHCKVGTVKSNIHLAMKELAQHYKRLTKEETL